MIPLKIVKIEVGQAFMAKIGLCELSKLISRLRKIVILARFCTLELYFDNVAFGQ